jgi:hypothetical protein
MKALCLYSETVGFEIMEESTFYKLIREKYKDDIMGRYVLQIGEDLCLVYPMIQSRHKHLYPLNKTLLEANSRFNIVIGDCILIYANENKDVKKGLYNNLKNILIREVELRKL